MRWMSLLLLAVALAGCSDSRPDLGDYLMSPLDAPDGCALIDLEGEGKPWADLLSMQENPGNADPEMFREGDLVPDEVLVALYRCTLDGETYDLASMAQRFADAATAREWTEVRVVCDGDPTWLQGAVLASIEDMDAKHNGFHDDVGRAVQRIEGRTGAEPYC